MPKETYNRQFPKYRTHGHIRLYVSFVVIFCTLFASKAQVESQTPDSIKFSMNVYNSSNKLPLSGVKVSVSGLSGGFSVDSIGWIDRKTELMEEARRAKERGDRMDLPDFSDPMNNTVRYSVMVPYDSVLIVSLIKPGFEGRTMRIKTNEAKVYDNDNIAYFYAGKYGIYPEDKSLRLKELTVTATKIKMYHNGDTLVYNADAFNLPDGSMLDALIRALPGASLSRRGQITINGEPVSELLVNGKKFFNGDPIVALENLPHYTVKDIKVYKKAPDEIAYSRKVEERNKDDDRLVLDVNLKKEFSRGLITNYTLGGGVNIRNDPSLKWLGRIFALVYDSRIEYGLYLQGNNVNSDASVDGSGRWSTSDIHIGLVTSVKSGATFKTYWKDQQREGFNSNLTVSGRKKLYESQSEKTELFTEGSRLGAYENTRKTRTMDLRWDNLLTRHFRYGLFKTSIDLNTERERRNESSNSRQSDLENRESVDPLTEAVKYRQTLKNDELSRSYEGNGRLSYALDPYLIPAIARMKLEGNYNFRTSRLDNNSARQIIYPDDPVNNFYQIAKGRQTRTDNSGSLALSIGSAIYTYKKFGLEGAIDYSFSIRDNRGDLNRYYDNPAELGPALLTRSSAMLLDEINSYDSRSTENINKFGANLVLRFWNLRLNLASEYELNYRQYQENRVHNHIDLRKYSEMWTPSAKVDILGIYYSFSTYVTLPQMRWLNDQEDTTDPMNISRGNPNLKNPRYWVYSLGYHKSFGKRHHSINASVDYRKVDDAFSRARFLNPETGAVISTPMNVNGNRSTSQSLGYSQSFGPRNRFFIQNQFSHSLRHNVDYSSEIDNPGTIGSDYRTFGDRFTFSFSIRDFNVRANVDMRFNRQFSEKYTFANARYSDVDYTLEAQGILPWGIGLETSLTLNTRYGYGNSDIDRPYWVWNLTLSKKFARHWLVKIHGYDILQQIPTFSRSIDTQFISMTRYNTQPSYVLLSLTYNLTITPKRK